MQRRSYLRILLALTALTFLSAPSSSVTAAPQHEFGLKQYEAFHDVLHPLQHEALPNNDFKRIRADSRLLVRRGNAIVRLGIPRGVSKEQRPEFRSELRKFSNALAKFHRDALRGTDEQLKGSFDATHDSFELLASMVRPG